MTRTDDWRRRLLVLRPNIDLARVERFLGREVDADSLKPAAWVEKEVAAKTVLRAGAIARAEGKLARPLSRAGKLAAKRKAALSRAARKAKGIRNRPGQGRPREWPARLEGAVEEPGEWVPVEETRSQTSATTRAWGLRKGRYGLPAVPGEWAFTSKTFRAVDGGEAFYVVLARFTKEGTNG